MLHEFQTYTGCPNKSVTFLTKHETIAFCSIAKIPFDYKRVCINLDFDTLDSPICEIFSEIRRFKDLNVLLQEPILGVSDLPTSLYSSTSELPKMMYICQ